MRKPREAAICPDCKKLHGVYIPRGGDGTLYVIRRHGSKTSQVCEGSYADVDWKDVIYPDEEEKKE
jgi:hypothetical protein